MVHVENGNLKQKGGVIMKKLLCAVMAAAMALALGAPVLAETYKSEAQPNLTFRDDHGKLRLATGQKDHEPAGLAAGGDGGDVKLWPNTTYYFMVILDPEGEAELDPRIDFDLLTNDRYFNFSYTKTGTGKSILLDADVLAKALPEVDIGFDGGRYGVLKLVTGPSFTDDEYLFGLTGKFKVKEKAVTEALYGLEPGDVIQVDFGRFVVGARKKESSDVVREAGQYAMVWDPAEADRNTLEFETEAGTLFEVHMKGSTDTGVVYVQVNTAWKPFEEAGLVPEQAFPNGDAAVYSFQSTNNLLDDTSRADLYIHNHPDTALGGESMTDLFEAGELYVYAAAFQKDGTVSLTDIRGNVSVGLLDGEKVLRFRDRALTNIILSTVPYQK